MKALHLLAPILATCVVAAEMPASNGPAKPTVQASPAAAIYDSDPQHLWNRLHAAFYQRELDTNRQGVRAFLGPDVLDPPLGLHPRYLLDDQPFARCDSLLDEFLGTHGERLFAAAPLKCAILQRDLWAVFDLLQEENDGALRNMGESPTGFTSTHQDRRAILSRKLARAIAVLARSREQLEALPRNYTLAIESKAFPSAAGSQSRADYLPSDLFAKNSPWLELTESRPVFGAPFYHTLVVSGRSVFRVFYRPPTNPDGAAQFARWLVQQRKVAAAAEDFSGNKWESIEQSIPIGSQFLLLREMVSVDDQWNLVATHVIESVQVRVYRRDAPKLAKGKAASSDLPGAMQLFEDFELDRKSLFQGKNGGLKPHSFGEPRLMGYTALGRLAADKDGRAFASDPFPNDCTLCHVANGEAEKPKTPLMVQSLHYSGRLTSPPRENGSAEATLRWKAERQDFRRLRSLGAD